VTESRWLTGRKEIAGYLGVTGRTISRMVARYSDFPVKVLGRRMMAKPSDIDEWVRRHAATPCEKCGGMVVG
jgi:predicted DNA-binding transcriptional regulator AlpA